MSAKGVRADSVEQASAASSGTDDAGTEQKLREALWALNLAIEGVPARSDNKAAARALALDARDLAVDALEATLKDSRLWPVSAGELPAVKRILNVPSHAPMWGRLERLLTMQMAGLLTTNGYQGPPPATSLVFAVKSACASVSGIAGEMRLAADGTDPREALELARRELLEREAEAQKQLATLIGALKGLELLPLPWWRRPLVKAREATILGLVNLVALPGLVVAEIPQEIASTVVDTAVVAVVGVTDENSDEPAGEDTAPSRRHEQATQSHPDLAGSLDAIDLEIKQQELRKARAEARLAERRLLSTDLPYTVTLENVYDEAGRLVRSVTSQLPDQPTPPHPL